MKLRKPYKAAFSYSRTHEQERRTTPAATTTRGRDKKNTYTSRKTSSRHVPRKSGRFTHESQMHGWQAANLQNSRQTKTKIMGPRRRHTINRAMGARRRRQRRRNIQIQTNPSRSFEKKRTSQRNDKRRVLSLRNWFNNRLPAPSVRPPRTVSSARTTA